MVSFIHHTMLSETDVMPKLHSSQSLQQEELDTGHLPEVYPYSIMQQCPSKNDSAGCVSGVINAESILP